MNKYVYTGLIFALGVATGVTPTYFVLKKDFAKSLDAAVADVKAVYSKRNEQSEQEVTVPEPYIEAEADADDYIEVENLDGEKLKLMPVEEPKTAYDMALESIEETEEAQTTPVLPFMIAAHECGSEPYHFNTLMMTFFSDEVLTDDDYIPLEPDEIVDTLGMNINDISRAFNNEGWEEDHLYIRNIERETDYEIAYSYEEYSEYLEKHPYLTS